MTDLAAPLLLFRRRSTLEQLVLDPELEIGAGGEAVVYHVPHDRSLVAKVYHDPAIERARKLALMLDNPPALPEGTAIAWPADLLVGGGRAFAGFLMPFAEGPRVFEFYNPVTRRAQAPGFHSGLLHRAGRNLAAAFDALHAAGYVVGDVNESNILVSPSDAAVTLVDADSFQVRDPRGGIFRSRVGKPEFTPPELQGVSFGEVDRAPEHDRFGLAVLLYLLLMEGTHPFAARMEPGVDAAPVEDRIRDGLFPHARADDDCHPPRLSPRFDALDAGVRELFMRAFVAGHADPAARPSAAEWRGALEAAEAALETCEANSLHRHAAGLEACPWCERMRLLGGRDPFPVAIPASPRAPRPRRVPRARAASSPSAQAPAAAVVSPFGMRQAPQPFVPPPTPLPAVFGPSGLVNPAVVIPTALVLLTVGGAMALLGLLGLVWSAYALSQARYRKLGWPTAAAGAVMAGVALVIMALPHEATHASAFDGGAEAPVVPYAPPVGGAAVEAGGPGGLAPPRPADPSGIHVPANWAASLLPDIHSQPISRLATLDIPAPGDDEAAPASPDSDARVLATVARPPQLTNESLVSKALAVQAWQRASTAPSGQTELREDTVVLWLRIGPDGRVAEGGWNVIQTTRPVATQAALDAVPYLRYLPAEDEKGAVSVWAAQRMLIEL